MFGYLGTLVCAKSFLETLGYVRIYRWHIEQRGGGLEVLRGMWTQWLLRTNRGGGGGGIDGGTITTSNIDQRTEYSCLGNNPKITRPIIFLLLIVL